MFNCSTLDTVAGIYWMIEGDHQINYMEEGGVKMSTLTVLASDDHNQSMIICYGRVNNTVHASPPALLLIQGQ